MHTLFCQVNLDSWLQYLFCKILLSCVQILLWCSQISREHHFPNPHMSSRSDSSFSSPSHPALRWADTFTPFCHFQLCRCRNTTQSGQSETNSCRNTPQCQWVYFCCGFSSELTGAADTSSWEETHITWRADEALLPPVGTERYCNNNVITVYMQL